MLIVNIICTQPRPISVISVAAQISSERGESLGETVGYQIRLEAKRSNTFAILHHWSTTSAAGSIFFVPVIFLCETSFLYFVLQYLCLYLTRHF